MKLNLLVKTLESEKQKLEKDVEKFNERCDKYYHQIMQTINPGNCLKSSSTACLSNNTPAQAKPGAKNQGGKVSAFENSAQALTP